MKPIPALCQKTVTELCALLDGGQISSVEIVSFSLMMGKAPSSNRRSRVLWKFAFRLPPSAMSGAVIRSWATV